MRNRIPSLLAAVAATMLFAQGCQLPPVADTHALAPDYLRWQAVTARPAPDLYRHAVRVLVDSGYTIATTDPAVGVVVTQLRRVQPPRGAAQDAFRLQVRVDSLGADSSAVVITGDSCFDDDDEAPRCYRASARSAEWSEVQRIGNAIVAGPSPLARH